MLVFNQNILAILINTYYFLIKKNMTSAHITSNFTSDMNKVLVSVIWNQWSFLL
jgi:hypothetical protein